MDDSCRVMRVSLRNLLKLPLALFNRPRVFEEIVLCEPGIPLRKPTPGRQHTADGQARSPKQIPTQHAVIDLLRATLTPRSRLTGCGSAEAITSARCASYAH